MFFSSCLFGEPISTFSSSTEWVSLPGFLMIPYSSEPAASLITLKGGAILAISLASYSAISFFRCCNFCHSSCYRTLFGSLKRFYFLIFDSDSLGMSSKKPSSLFISGSIGTGRGLTYLYDFLKISSSGLKMPRSLMIQSLSAGLFFIASNRAETGYVYEAGKSPELSFGLKHFSSLSNSIHLGGGVKHTALLFSSFSFGQ